MNNNLMLIESILSLKLTLRESTKRVNALIEAFNIINKTNLKPITKMEMLSYEREYTRKCEIEEYEREEWRISQLPLAERMKLWNVDEDLAA